jgi:SAM-dependent methyltransferase
LTIALLLPGNGDVEIQGESQIHRLGSAHSGSYILTMPLNYSYILDRALASTCVSAPKILDFGSGQGQFVSLALEHGVDVYGVDVPGIETNARVKLIIANRIPFADCWFDVVVSNQVFEHIQHPDHFISEIHRVLKPGGTFITLFPDNTVWFEGHVGLYFVHWMSPSSKLLRAYLILCHKLGLGYQRGTKGAAEWADYVKELMISEVVYHDPAALQRWWSDVFGRLPERLELDWMLYRLEASPRLRKFAIVARLRVTALLLRTICRLRAGLVLRIKKAAQ